MYASYTCEKKNVSEICVESPFVLLVFFLPLLAGINESDRVRVYFRTLDPYSLWFSLVQMQFSATILNRIMSTSSSVKSEKKKDTEGFPEEPWL